MHDIYDVVVIGAGSSGGVAAARLSEDPECRVLLVEAGPDFPDEANRLPLFVVSSEHSWRVSGVPELDWNFVDADLGGNRGGRPIRLPRGKMVGGSSMVNSTIAVRPAPSDLDRWARDFGATGWDFASLLPLYRRIETDRDFGGEPIHGDSGPIVIQRYPERAWAAVNRNFAEACDHLGFAHAADLNDGRTDAGVYGALPHNRFKEEKQGTLNTYLRAARGRPNLTIVGGTMAVRVLVESGRATGVELATPEGTRSITAGTVILSAGAYNTPPILQRSGIGPAGLLDSLGIPVVADLPVGRRLADHPGCAFFFHARGLGEMTGRLFPATLRGRPGSNGDPVWHTHSFPADEEEDRCGMFVYLCRQHSLGSVEIVGIDHRQPPRIDHAYLADPGDRAAFRDAYEETRELLATPAFASRNAKLETAPEEVDAHVEKLLASAHHQSGGCCIGQDPADSVVGADLAVHGIAGLYVADSSVFPDTIMHNTNLTCYVIGEKVAEVVGR